MLQGRKILVTGLLSSRSIAYGIARALAREGATLAFTYQTEEVHVRVADLAKEFGAVPVLPCDVARDEDIEVLFGRLAGEWEGLDGIVHSIAFAPREVLKGELLDNLTRDAFRIAHDVSSYSFAALAKAGLPMMQGRPAALLTLTYLGRGALGPELQRHGDGEGEPRSQRALPGAGPGPQGHTRERHFSRTGQDARRRRHQRLRQDPQVRRGERAPAA
jgi:enoyl-[acyl-carrier protein] reductase I